jgi:hypothetical protein
MSSPAADSSSVRCRQRTENTPRWRHLRTRRPTGLDTVRLFRQLSSSTAQLHDRRRGGRAIEAQARAQKPRSQPPGKRQTAKPAHLDAPPRACVSGSGSAALAPCVPRRTPPRRKRAAADTRSRAVRGSVHWLVGMPTRSARLSKLVGGGPCANRAPALPGDVEDHRSDRQSDDRVGDR